MSMEVTASVLRKSKQLICTLDSHELKVWCGRIRPSKYETGQVLFYQGHHPYGLYIIYSGILSLHNGSQNKEKRVLQIQSGTVLGLRELLSNKMYPLTGTIQGETYVSFVEKTRVLDWIENQDSILSPEVQKLLNQNQS